MALEYDISNLKNKVENEGTSNAGRLTAAEWNYLIGAVEEVQTKAEGAIKGIKYNGAQVFDKIDKDGYLEMTVADSSGYDVWIHPTNPPAIIARGSECPISVSVTNKVYQQDGKTVPNSASAIVEIYINDILVNTGQVYDLDFGNTESSYYDPSKNTVYTFDLSTAKTTSLLVGSDSVNNIKVKVNNRSGVIKDHNCDVEVIELSLAVPSFEDTKVFNESKKPNILAIVSGNDAQIKAYVDGEQIIFGDKVNAGETTNFGENIFDTVNTHGVHTLEIWAEVVRTISGKDYVISTQPKSYTYIYGTKSETPVVMSNMNNLKPEEYSTLNVNYIAYKYNDTLTAVTDTVLVELCEHLGYDDSGEPIPGKTLGEPAEREITFDVTTNSGTGTAGISLFPVKDGENTVSLVGKKLIKISIGDFSQYTEIEVLKSSVKLNQLGGYAVYLTSAGRNNKQPNKNEWISKDGKDKDGSKLIVNSTFSDNVEFIDTGSGWIADSDGNVALHLKKGRYFTLNYKPFSENPTFQNTYPGNGRGKTISFELATRNCLKNDAVVVSCMDDSNGTDRGFEITASSAIIKSNVFGLQAKFRENTRVKIDFVIEGKKTEYKYTTIAGKDATEADWEKDKTSSEALCIIYVDGVYQTLKVIPNDTTFLQGNSTVEAKEIVFGSEYCDLDIYNIRIYDTALTPSQIVNNYSYDTPKYEDKLAIAARNDIFDNTAGNKPNINIANLRKARPDLPFWYAKMEVVDGKEVVLPYDKTNWRVQTLTKWDNPKNNTEKFGGAISFTTDAGQLRNQGTSSMTYPWPWRNWDWKLNKDQASGEFLFGDDTTGTKWCQYLGMNNTENISKITLKKDYASSEMCNNAITSEYFTDMAIGIADSYPNVLSPAMRELGINTPYRLTFKAIPCFMFQELNDANAQGSAGKGYDALGMMNLIPNKNECGYLGFMGKYKWNPNPGSGESATYAQSWELTDNMDDWFWYKKIEPVHVETYIDNNGNEAKKIINDCIECYEARYPKDSTVKWESGAKADFGSTPDNYNTLTSNEKNTLDDEQRDIIEFHNWLVDCNRQIPEDYKAEHGAYRTLSGDEMGYEWNLNEDGSYNTLDTPDYRLKKFIAEAPKRMIIDQFCMYYIWRETFHAFDSGFKNLQLYTMGTSTGEHPDVDNPLQWGCMVRDADTTLGIENTGKDIFPPHLEDTDYYTADKDAEGNAVSNVKFVYGAANNMYHSKSIDSVGGHAILNGQLGTLWINLRDGFGSKIAEIYKALSASTKAKWNASDAIKRFRDHQEKWCENLYNFGMRQYFGGAPFTKWIESGLGDKKNSRASWLERGFYYRDSKYKCLSDKCTIRAVTYKTPDITAGNTANEPLKMKAYIPMYFLTGATEEDPSTCNVSIRVTDTNNTFDVIPGPAGLGCPDSGDQNRWFWGSSQLTEIGDLARVLKAKIIQDLNLPKVKEFSLGHESARDGKTYLEYYDETIDGVTTTKTRELQNEFLTSFAVDSMKQLTILDVTNHKLLNSIEGLEKCTQLQELYARGTDSLQSINLPATTSIKKLFFGNALRTINLTDITGIEQFELENGKNVEKLLISNCGSYMAARTYEIMLQVLPNLEKVHDAVTNPDVCKLNGINWERCTAEELERLLNINAELSGKINLTTTLNNDLKVKLVNKYGDIDNSKNALHITYVQNVITKVKMPSKLYISKEGDTQLTFISTPDYANTYKTAEWTLSSNEFATINSKTGVITRNSNIADETSPSAKLKVVVYQIPDENGVEREPIESNEVIVYFYERHAKPGDIVYHDGTFTDEKDDTKTPIGVCFYVDPADKNNRLMVALENIYRYNTSDTYAWGISTGWSSSSNWYGSPQINPANYGFDEDMNTMAKLIDLPEIPNVVSHGGDLEIAQMLDDNYRDSSAKDNDKFKKFGFKTCMGNIGWVEADKDITIDYNKVVEAGKSYPAGYIYTMAAIQRRNIVMSKFKDLKITGTQGLTSEFENLFEDFTNAENNVIINNWNTGASTYMYPAPSLVYAYEPGGEGNINGLLDKFKKNNWFIPSSGEAVRIAYYMRQYLINDSTFEGSNAFKTAIESGILKNTGWLTKSSLSEGLNSATIITSTEYDDNAQKYVTVTTSGISSFTSEGQNRTGMCGNNYKYSNARLRPICRF